MCEADEFRDFRWRIHERDVFRELNKNPFIAYPIKETVNTMAHKASLLLQAALGCVDLSDVPETVRRQIALDTCLLFERMHRLVRAVVECKASDLDGVTCRVALDLARSMAARAWEGKSMQLMQVPQLGPVFMRKLVASGITTVHDLAKAGASNIERILSRNPPFGKKMTDELAHFPRLTLEARIAAELPRSFNSGQQPVARIDATLGFSNSLGKPKWRGKIPSVTFMAETTEGVLAHWWRGSLKKFKDENEHKLYLQFEVDLSSAKDEIICYFACEDIVGTVVTRRLEHGLPPSAFPSRKEPPSQLSKTSGRSAASLMDDDIGDNDLLDIAKEGENQSEACLVISEDSDVDSQWSMMNQGRKNHVDDTIPEQKDDFAPSQNSEEETVPWQPIQLPNGKFKCNHRCADAGLKNRNGKACAHRCCREGLDVPRKPKGPSMKRKAGLEEIVVADSASKLTSKPTTKKVRTATPKGRPSIKNVTREPLASAPANRQDRPLMDLDDFDLDGDGLFDLTQVEGAIADDRQSYHRSPFRVKEPITNEGSYDKEIKLFASISDDALQDDLASPIGSRDTTKGRSTDVGERKNPLQAELRKTQSNSTDNFSGDSVFDGVTADECHEEPFRSHSSRVGTTGVPKKRRGNFGNVPLHDRRKNESSWEESSLDTPPTMTRYLDQLSAKHLEKGSRANVVRQSPSHSEMTSRAGEAGCTSSTIPSTMGHASLRQVPDTAMEAKEFEDETYIFSDKYVLPPPRESFGEGSVILPHVSDGRHLAHDADASAVRISAKLDSSSTKDDDLSTKLQQDPEWDGFEPGFTDEFRDLVEFI